MDFEQWKLCREIGEQNSTFNELMRCTATSTHLLAVILLGVFLLVVGFTLAVA